MGCGICRVLYEELMASAKRDEAPSSEGTEALPPNQLRDDRSETALSAQSTAQLGVIHDIGDEAVFRLDFKLEWALTEEAPNIVKRTFVLKQTDSPIAAFRTPMSVETSSSEVFKLALSWITQCDSKCDPPCAKRAPLWYPTRLIDIRALKSQTYLDTRRKQYTDSTSNGVQDLDKITVKLEQRRRDDPRNGLDVFGAGRIKQPNNLYVTLSHCWGQSHPYTLNSDTVDDLKAGIEIEKLPKTFRHAISFASQLHNVGWIWIDSLCIQQDDDKDWLHEAALMQRVYRESFLNISATAASDSDGGLYSNREYRSLWENEVSLKVDGIPGLALHEEEHHHNHNVKAIGPKKGYFGPSFWKWFAQLFRAPAPQRLEEAEPVAKIDWGGEKPLTLALPEPEGLRRCVLIDTSHWDNLVNKAPVNVRAWVLQERLLAPRVLHFCEGSIAWECSGFTRAEGHPTGLPRFQLQHDRILPEVPLKGLDPSKHGKELRKIRLGDSKEPDPHIPPRVRYGFELWARVVEMYSRMNLTLDKDKLIALSGIAQLMSTNILDSEEGPARYVAGMWDRYLESQLLWRVEPIFIRHNRTFQQPGRRPPKYRAPSFSWASVDAQKATDDQPGNGITYGEVTDRDLLVELDKKQKSVVIENETETDNAFGLVTGGHIMLWGMLRKIKLSKGEMGRYYWRLFQPDASWEKIENDRHHNVYLDAPSDDERLHGIFESDNVYCLPAARGPRTEDEESKYIICLILQQATGHDPLQRASFRRIGMTKLSGWGDKHAYGNILEHHATYTTLPHWPGGFDHDTNRHLIRII